MKVKFSSPLSGSGSALSFEQLASRVWLILRNWLPVLLRNEPLTLFSSLWNPGIKEMASFIGLSASQIQILYRCSLPLSPPASISSSVHFRVDLFSPSLSLSISLLDSTMTYFCFFFIEEASAGSETTCASS